MKQNRGHRLAQQRITGNNTWQRHTANMRAQIHRLMTRQGTLVNNEQTINKWQDSRITWQTWNM